MSGVTVVVVGSFGTDMVVQTPRIPTPGQTLLGSSFAVHQGGKGGNQAIAAARLGAKVRFVGCVGDDERGEVSLKSLIDAGIDTSAIITHPTEWSGVAVIFVADDGENAIVVDPGANGKLRPEDIEPTVFEGADVMLTQLEIPLDTAMHALRLAKEAGVVTILNPAPAAHVPADMLSMVDFLTPNESEAAELAGISDHMEAGHALLKKGVGEVLLTLGEKGSYIVSRDLLIETFSVDAVDTTGAGDAFNGALSVALGGGRELEEAVRFANAAGAVAVTAHGAQPSMPTQGDVDRLMG